MSNPPEKPSLPDPNTPPAKVPPPPRRSMPPGFIIAVVAIVLLFMFFNQFLDHTPEITYGFFHQQLEADNIETLDLQGMKVTGEFKDPPVDPTGKTDRKTGEPAKLEKKFTTTIPLIADRNLDRLILAKMATKYKVTTPADSMYFLYLLSMVGLPLLLLVGVFYLLRRSQNSIFGGGGILGFSKSPARKYEDGERRVTFNDVAGLEGVKAELQEIVEFLKNPKKFQRLGGRVPKGILLMGPPGTGKTLLGRAVAGEAGVPFYSINGSEFIQMFVGVGAGRVRDLFATAKDSAPCILFIDEIDAVGRHRGTGVGGGNDEREQTLNQILSEMDGFTQTEAVIVMAATNRPDVLDPALLRPGRFDRHITVDRPTFKGRLAIFGVHTRGIPLADNVDLERLAAGSVGLTGADIRNLVNEATLWASCHDKEQVEMSDFDYARDKVLMGAKREEILSGEEKSLTAYHEAGHTLLAWLDPVADRLHKVSIIPRGRTLGVTQLLPDEDRVNVSERRLQTHLLIAMGGRAAEKLAFDEFSAGAENDLDRATQIARRMVTHWGMSERLGPVAFRDSEDHPFLGARLPSRGVSASIRPNSSTRRYRASSAPPPIVPWRFSRRTATSSNAWPRPWKPKRRSTTWPSRSSSAHRPGNWRKWPTATARRRSKFVDTHPPAQLELRHGNHSCLSMRAEIVCQRRTAGQADQMSEVRQYADDPPGAGRGSQRNAACCADRSSCGEGDFPRGAGDAGRGISLVGRFRPRCGHAHARHVENITGGLRSAGMDRGRYRPGDFFLVAACGRRGVCRHRRRRAGGNVRPGFLAKASKRRWRRFSRHLAHLVGLGMAGLVCRVGNRLGRLLGRSPENEYSPHDPRDDWSCRRVARNHPVHATRVPGDGAFPAESLAPFRFPAAHPCRMAEVAGRCGACLQGSGACREASPGQRENHGDRRQGIPLVVDNGLACELCGLWSVLGQAGRIPGRDPTESVGALLLYSSGRLCALAYGERIRH